MRFHRGPDAELDWDGKDGMLIDKPVSDRGRQPFYNPRAGFGNAHEDDKPHRKHVHKDTDAVQGTLRLRAMKHNVYERALERLIDGERGWF